MRDTTRQIGRSKLSRPIYDELKQSSNVLWTDSTCCVHLPFTAVLFVFGQFGEILTNTHLIIRAFAMT